MSNAYGLVSISSSSVRFLQILFRTILSLSHVGKESVKREKKVASLARSSLLKASRSVLREDFP